MRTRAASITALLACACSHQLVPLKPYPEPGHPANDAGALAQAMREARLKCHAASLPLATPADEATFGRSAIDAVTAPPPGVVRDSLPHQAATEAYLSKVGDALASHSARPELHWSFRAYAEEKPMVHWAPGGAVAVSGGWVRTAENEAQLAAGLAHVIAHVAFKDNDRWYAEYRRRACENRALLEVYRSGALAGDPQMPPELAESLLHSPTVAQMNIEVTLRTALWNNHTAEEEMIFDRVALELMRAAGYDAAEYPKAMAKLEQNPDWMAPHPGSDLRRDAVEKALHHQKE